MNSIVLGNQNKLRHALNYCGKKGTAQKQSQRPPPPLVLHMAFNQILLLPDTFCMCILQGDEEEAQNNQARAQNNQAGDQAGAQNNQAGAEALIPWHRRVLSGEDLSRYMSIITCVVTVYATAFFALLTTGASVHAGVTWTMMGFFIGMAICMVLAGTGWFRNFCVLYLSLCCGIIVFVVLLAFCVAAKVKAKKRHD
ncbi:hypothetical protein QJS04_geneDACA024408 [Acorus gramineus]|uniref:Uncharacterized protein n=1 Tax=Acorus gramineus TaxID=55184 RepID=A0AAV8ZY20_ACOGR|nr:hypothetical protein QJS04_geneDACA024408 [Acorus gramineus]